MQARLNMTRSMLNIGINIIVPYDLSGGIGCELLKGLALAGFRQLHVIE